MRFSDSILKQMILLGIYSMYEVCCDNAFFRHFQYEERWLCIFIRCDCSFTWRGIFQPGKTSHLFYYAGILAWAEVLYFQKKGV